MVFSSDVVVDVWARTSATFLAWPGYGSRLHEVSPAHVQGLQNNEKHFKELLFVQALREYLQNMWQYMR